MATKNDPGSQFESDIVALIAEIEACMPAAPKKRDREFRYQSEAFHERRQQAKMLADRLGMVDSSEWFMRSGDAYRIEASLKASLAYFSGTRVGNRG